MIQNSLTQKLQFPRLVELSLYKKISLLLLNKFQNKDSLKALYIEKSNLDYLKRTKGRNFTEYYTYSKIEKSILKDIANTICIQCSQTIHARMKELGLNSFEITGAFDRYYRSEETPINSKKHKATEIIKEFLNTSAPPQMLAKYKELQASHIKRDISPFKINRIVLSALLRTDTIIRQESEIMINTIMTFNMKKAGDYGLKKLIQRAYVEQDELFNAGIIGYLTASVFWSPKKISTNDRTASFVSYGWYDARSEFYILFNGMRMVRFPFNVEDKISRIHSKIKKRELELISTHQDLNFFQIQAIIAMEMKTDVDTIKEIFMLFASPSSVLPAYLPTHINLIRLDKCIANSTDSQLKFVADINAADCYTWLENKILRSYLLSTIKLNCTNTQNVILRLVFGLAVTEDLWYGSRFYERTKINHGTDGIHYYDLPIKCYTLDEIGQLLNISRQVVGKTKIKAMQKIRSPFLWRYLRSFLDC